VVVIGELVDGRYRIVRRLGAGGMAEVFEATHVTTRRNVALKLVDLNAIEPAKREAYVARFGREARAASAVSAPHIAQVLDAGNDATTGAPYLAMELLSGEDLRETLKRLGALPERVASKIALQTCRALLVAHERGIVHRDVKPANLFLHRTEGGEVQIKLVDFGVAKLTDDRLVDPETSELTRTGTLLGTPHYMSPEQLLQTRTADHRSDLWSLGVVMHKMLVGETPFENAASMGLTVLAICAEPLVPIARRAPFLDAKLAGLVDRCLERDLGRRVQSARAVLDVLSTLPGATEPLVESELVALSPELKDEIVSFGVESRRDTSDVLRSDAETTALTLSSESQPNDSRPERPRKSSSPMRWLALAVLVGVIGTVAGIGWMQSERPKRMDSVLGRHAQGVTVAVSGAAPVPTPEASAPPATAGSPALRVSASATRTNTSTSTSARPRPSTSTSTPKSSGVGLRDGFE
jgi:eukaryotic-like serine/threonine-protein kinase